MRYEFPDCQDRAVWDIWLSMYHLPAMVVADELGVFQALEAGSATTDEVARQLGLNRRATNILLSMLAALRLTVPSEGRHRLADVTRTYLVPRSRYYWGPLLRTFGASLQQRATLIRALRSEEDTAAVRSELPFKAWERGRMDRAQAELTSRIMHCHSLPASVAAARHRELTHVARLLDVGGGSGCFSIAIAQYLPNIRCTVMDLPEVCDVARNYIAEGGVADRVDTAPVDMFHEAWPLGYDGVLLSNVFHDWSPEINLFLAQRAHAALPSGGWILVHEMLLADDGASPITTASFSMQMLFGTQGRQYSFRELRQVLEQAGFVRVGACESYGYYSMVSGQKP